MFKLDKTHKNVVVPAIKSMTYFFKFKIITVLSTFCICVSYSRFWLATNLEELNFMGDEESSTVRVAERVYSQKPKHTLVAIFERNDDERTILSTIDNFGEHHTSYRSLCYE